MRRVCGVCVSVKNRQLLEDWYVIGNENITCYYNYKSRRDEIDEQVTHQLKVQ